MSNKYIIRNCPALGFQIGYYCSDIADYCKNCTDCVMKRIVDECKWETNNINIDLRGDLAERVLSELNIQEIE